ncbi:MAG: hypothetical protein ABIH29_02620 [Candidatus Micrarchaeota archaeon]
MKIEEIELLEPGDRISMQFYMEGTSKGIANNVFTVIRIDYDRDVELDTCRGTNVFASARRFTIEHEKTKKRVYLYVLEHENEKMTYIRTLENEIDDFIPAKEIQRAEEKR